MRIGPPTGTPGSPSTAIDWRLLLPIGTGTRVLAAGVAAPEIARTLSRVGAEAYVHQPGRMGDGFTVVAVPLGLEGGTLSSEPATRAALSELFHVLVPGGALLVGFTNPLALRRAASGRAASTLRPARMARALESAGYRSVRLYGALGGLSTPTYILPLQTGPLAFVLDRHLRPKHRLLRLLPRGLALPMLGLAIPAYFAVATRPATDVRPLATAP